jgi:hypothetical protein
MPPAHSYYVLVRPHSALYFLADDMADGSYRPCSCQLIKGASVVCGQFLFGLAEGSTPRQYIVRDLNRRVLRMATLLWTVTTQSSVCVHSTIQDASNWVSRASLLVKVYIAFPGLFFLVFFFWQQPGKWRIRAPDADEAGSKSDQTLA